MTHAERQHRFRVALAFGLVYVLWGSTYLGIRIAVEHIPPALMAGTRFLIAGPIMLAACLLTGRRIAVSAGELLRLGIIGVMLLSIANVVLCWAELYVRTGLASLIIASVPIWFLVIDTWILRGDRVSVRGFVGLALGVVGIVVLIWPKLVNGGNSEGGRMQLIGALSLVFSALTWAAGSVLSRRWQTRVDAFAATGWEMTIAGTVNVVVALVLGEPAHSTWTWRGMGAILYLVIFGSLIGYSAYIWLLNHVPTSKLATYAYVNPVVAVFLGWLVLHERVDAYILAGTAIIIPAVALVTSAKVRPRFEAAEKEPELPACEAGAD